MSDSPIASSLLLLQLMDSSFPVGTFAHSYGLEQSVRDRHVTDAAGVEGFVASVLEMQVATTEARALVRAHEATSAGDFAGAAAADRELHATKGTTELRAASTSTGRRLLQEVVAHPDVSSPVIEAYLDAVERDEVPGTHAVALGVVGASLGVGATELVAALLFSTANTLHQAAMRLLPVSHRDAQSALHHHRREIPRLADDARLLAEDGYASFAPAQEIASMRHEGATVRFFAS
jgi:urease accessory protein